MSIYFRESQQPAPGARDPIIIITIFHKQNMCISSGNTDYHSHQVSYDFSLGKTLIAKVFGKKIEHWAVRLVQSRHTQTFLLEFSCVRFYHQGPFIPESPTGLILQGAGGGWYSRRHKPRDMGSFTPAAVCSLDSQESSFGGCLDIDRVITIQMCHRLDASRLTKAKERSRRWKGDEQRG